MAKKLKKNRWWKVARMRPNDNVRVGRTIAGEWERQESESERLAARKKEHGKKIFKIVSLLVILVVVGVIAAMEASVWINNRAKEEEAARIIQPAIEIIDEAGAGVTSRMREYVAQVEQDLADVGLTANRAVIPAGKMREVHLFLNGYDYYIKMNIDKETGVSAEDTKRMVEYVTTHDLHPEYIDVRIKGKAYFK